MRKTVITITAAALGSLAVASTASAAVLPALQKTQVTRVQVCSPTTTALVRAAGFTDNVNNTTGAATPDGVADNWSRVCPKPVNGKAGIIDAILNTRNQTFQEFTGPSLDPVTGRPLTRNATRQGAPVGKVVMTFPTGSTFQPKSTGKPFCSVPAGQGAKVLTDCASSILGTGWALVNTGQALGCSKTIPAGLNCSLAGGVEVPQPRVQLSETTAGSGAPAAGVPAACASELPNINSNSWNMYSQTWDATGNNTCVPWGHLYNRVRVYQGAIPEGKTALDRCSVIFVSQNSATVVSFSGQLTGAGTSAERKAGTKCGNVLTVNLPALWGSGSYPGELAFGWTLVDFRVILDGKNAFKAGTRSCVSKNMTVNSKITYSPRKFEDGKVNGGTAANGEDVRPATSPTTSSTKTAC